MLTGRGWRVRMVMQLTISILSSHAGWKLVVTPALKTDVTLQCSLGFRVWGFGLGFRVWGLGFRA